jgi:hypothetical protein
MGHARFPLCTIFLMWGRHLRIFFLIHTMKKLSWEVFFFEKNEIVLDRCNNRPNELEYVVAFDPALIFT